MPGKPAKLSTPTRSRETVAVRRALAITAAALLLGLVPQGLPGTAAAPATPTEREGAVGSDLLRIEKKVVRLTNARRIDRGCRPVRVVSTLNLAAQRHTNRMARAHRLEHQLPGEPGLGRRVTRAGYRGWTMIAENIAAGHPTARSVVRGWMQSPGHRRNILNCRYRHIGVGFARAANGTPYYTQVFGRR